MASGILRGSLGCSCWVLGSMARLLALILLRAESSSWDLFVQGTFFEMFLG